MSEVQHLYIEACNALRHYSSSIMQMRMLLIAQGFLVLSAAAYTLNYPNPIYFYAVIGFGLIFTLAIQRQQKNYLGDFETHLESVVELEKLLVNDQVQGSWSKYRDRHVNLRNETSAFHLLIESGLYNLFLLCFVLLGIMKLLGVLTGFE